MNETKRKGLVTELQCQLYFTSLGYNVSIPLGEDCKYDFIVDIENTLYKVQVKTCTIEENGITIKMTSSYLTKDGSVSYNYNKDEIDFFTTYYRNECYLIPTIKDASRKKLFFNKTKNSSFIEDYKALNIIEKIKNDKNFLEEEKNKEVNNSKLSNEDLEEIYDLLLHSNISQSQIANKFNVNKHTIYRINSGELRFNDNLIYPLRESVKKKLNYCLVCKAPIARNLRYCKECKKTINKKIVTYLERKELKKLIRDETFESIGKNYNVSGNAIRKWCTKYNLPKTKKEINSYTNEEWERI